MTYVSRGVSLAGGRASYLNNPCGGVFCRVAPARILDTSRSLNINIYVQSVASPRPVFDGATRNSPRDVDYCRPLAVFCDVASLPLAFWTCPAPSTSIFTYSRTCRRHCLLEEVVWCLGGGVTYALRAAPGGPGETPVGWEPPSRDHFACLLISSLTRE